MSRAERLLQLMQVLRRHRRPVTGQALAAETGISLRTLYRDIAALQGQGAVIDGEPGVGYVLRPGFLLPPLMFSAEEIEAVVLGSRWVAERGDSRLAGAAADALAKIASVLPADLRGQIEESALFVPPVEPLAGDAELGAIRKAIRDERKLAIVYRDAGGAVTQRTIWPIALGFFERVRIVAAWCELRADLRNFRIDRIASLVPKAARYPRRRAALLEEWRARENIASR